MHIQRNWPRDPMHQTTIRQDPHKTTIIPACQRLDVLAKARDVLDHIRAQDFRFPDPKATIKSGKCLCEDSTPCAVRLTYPAVCLDGAEAVPNLGPKYSPPSRWTPPYSNITQEPHCRMPCCSVAPDPRIEDCQCPHHNSLKNYNIGTTLMPKINGNCAAQNAENVLKELQDKLPPEIQKLVNEGKQIIWCIPCAGENNSYVMRYSQNPDTLNTDKLGKLGANC